MPRIPIHDHADFNSGGRLSAAQVQLVIGETTSSSTTTGVTDHGALTGLTDDDHPQYELRTEGGQSVVYAHGSMGATETFDPTDGNVHTGTLTANCTVTLNAPSGSGACTLELRLTQDPTGGWSITWPGSVTEQGTLDTDANAVNTIVLETLDGGTSWVAWYIGGTGVAALDDLTDVTITSPATGQRLRYNGSVWVNSALKWVPVMTYDGTNWLVAVDGSGNPIMTEA